MKNKTLVYLFIFYMQSIIIYGQNKEIMLLSNDIISPTSLTVFENHILFFAHSQKYGIELWRTDGTANGTKIVKDINTNGDCFYIDGERNNLANFIFKGYSLYTSNRKLFFFGANDGSSNQYQNYSGFESFKFLYVSDGTSSGTKPILIDNKKICISMPNNGSAFLVEFNGRVYFKNFGNGYIYSTDGTDKGTIQTEFKGEIFKAGKRLFAKTEIWNDNTPTYTWKTSVDGKKWLNIKPQGANVSDAYQNLNFFGISGDKIILSSGEPYIGMSNNEYKFWSKAKNIYNNNLPSEILTQNTNTFDDMLDSGLGENFFLMKEDSVKYLFHRFYDNQFNFTYTSTDTKFLLNYPIGLSILSNETEESNKAVEIYWHKLRPQRSFKGDFYVFINIEFEKKVYDKESKEYKYYNSVNDYKRSSGLYRYEDSGKITKVSELTFDTGEIDRNSDALSTITSTEKALYFQNGVHLVQWEGQNKSTKYQLPFYELKLFSNNFNNLQNLGNQNSNISVLEWKDNLLFVGGDKDSFSSKLYLTKRKNTDTQNERINSIDNIEKENKIPNNLSQEQVKEQFGIYVTKWVSLINIGEKRKNEFDKDIQILDGLFKKINTNSQDYWKHKFLFIYIICYNELYDRALPLCIELDNYFKENNLIGQYSEQYYINKIQLAEAYFNVGQDFKADKVCDEVLKSENKVIQNLAVELKEKILLKIGKYDEGKEKAKKVSEDELKKAIIIDSRKNFGIAIKSLEKQCDIQFEKSSYDSALVCYKGILNSWSILTEENKSIPFKDVNFFENTLMNIGKTYLELNKCDSAKVYFSKAKEVYELKFNRNEIYEFYIELAKMYLKCGDKGKADEIYKILNSEFKDFLGNTQNKNVGNYYLANNDYKNSKPIFEKNKTRLKNRVINFLEVYSEDEQRSFLRTIDDDINNIYSFCYKFNTKQPEVAEIAIENALTYKGSQLMARLLLTKFASSTKDTNFIKLFKEWKMLNFNKTQQALKENIDKSITTQIQEIEKELAVKSVPFRKFNDNFNISFNDINKSLKKNEAVIEFINFKYHNGFKFTDSTFYCAIILTPSKANPIMIPLFEEKQLQKIFAKAKSSNDSTTVSILYNNTQLYDLIWKPLESHLTNINTIYYSPAGLLNKISFSSIKNNLNQYLSDKSNIELKLVLSSKQLINRELPFKFQTNTNVRLFGGVNYEDKENLWREAIKKVGLDKSKENNNISFPRSGSSFRPLHGALLETDSIEAILKRKGINNVIKYTEFDANEERFNSFDGNSPDIINISTHGFFLEKQLAVIDTSFSLTGSQKISYFENSLLRSGLALAGANRVWAYEAKPYDNLKDGILTALEISNLNLSNTKLAVLSACETGLGDINGAEGVFGLQRAFKIAGVKYILMSLWKVPDEQTKELIVEFYKNLVNKNQDIEIAFENAQNFMKSNPKYKNNPYYWGAFVLLK